MASLGEFLKASLNPPGPNSDRTRQQIESLGGERTRFSQLARGFATGVNNIGTEQRVIGRTAASASGQDPRTATTAGGTLSEALRRAKARQGIVQRGDKSVRQQRLKDRLQLVRSDLSRRGAAIDLQGAGKQIQTGVNLNAASAKDAVSAAKAGAFGGALGSFAGILKGNKDREGSSGFFDFGKNN